MVGLCDYAAAKGGVMSLTKALAKELGEDRALKTNLLGEKCTAADIADLVAFLVSDKARFITGQTYVCDGGRSLSMKGTD